MSLVFNKDFEHPAADLQAVMAHEAEIKNKSDQGARALLTQI